MNHLIVHTTEPLNAETPLYTLRDDFVTSQKNLYIRSHGAVPTFSADEFRLRISGQVARPLSLGLADLKRDFPAVTVVATLQCAGNRRAELHAVRPVSGDPWAPGAIGNAVWTGAPLADVLQAAGAPADPSLHVWFTGADTVPTRDGVHFGASIPMSKAAASEVLLAYAVNGEPLAPEHGFPLRALVPGFAGVRSVKWLTELTVAAEPSHNPFQSHDYKLFPPGADAESANWDAGMTINEMPLNSAICIPAEDATVLAGPTLLRGYAFASGRAVTRVDVSADGGRHWAQASLTQERSAPWGWHFWEATLDLPRGEHELAVRAWDCAGQTQPGSPADVWNFKGYLCAAWHRVRVRAT